MMIDRRKMLAAGTAALTLRGRASRAADTTIRIGMMDDLSGPYADENGQYGVICGQQAALEFAAPNGMKVEVVGADHQNKADIAASIARHWFDEENFDMALSVGSSACALAVNTICREKNKVMLNTGAGTPDLTGAQCSPNTIHWVYDTYMNGRSTGGAVTRLGGDTWFFITANYSFGQQLERDATKFILEAGGKVLGHAVHPFPDTTDFSSFLIEAQSSGAKVLGFANAGDNLINGLKQAREFGLLKTMVPVAMQCHDSTVSTMRLDLAQGLRFTSTYYWDLNERTRAYNKRAIVLTKGRYPNDIQAGCYSATLHYLKVAKELGVAKTKADGRAVVAAMKAMPTDDDVFGNGTIREDGRAIHPAYLFQVKAPGESSDKHDVVKVIAVTPGDQAFRPTSEGGCPLVRG
jgi:branched-chain amino acid transport system substrate-binding protein